MIVVIIKVGVVFREKVEYAHVFMRTTRRPIVAEKHKGDKGILSIYKVTHNQFMVRYCTLHHKKQQNHYSLRGRRGLLNCCRLSGYDVISIVKKLV